MKNSNAAELMLVMFEFARRVRARVVMRWILLHIFVRVLILYRYGYRYSY